MPRVPSKAKLLQVIEIQKRISGVGVDLSAIMALIVDEMMQLLGAEGAAIELLENDFMVYRATSGIAQSHLGLKIPAKRSLSGLCALSAQPQYCADTMKDDRVNKAACQAIGLQSMMLVPLLHLQKVVGVLKVMSKRPKAFNTEDKQLLELISAQVGAAMYFATRFSASSLAYQATHDSMTKLANRSVFMEQLRYICAESEKRQNQFGVLIIDMDDLKNANDTHGHLFGDQLLTELAARIRNATRPTDVLARLGGDEFGVIIKDLKTPDALPNTIERLNSFIIPPYSAAHNLYKIKASIGGACFPADGATLEQLLEAADQRMYSAKRQAKGLTASV